MLCMSLPSTTYVAVVNGESIAMSWLPKGERPTTVGLYWLSSTYQVRGAPQLVQLEQNYFAGPLLVKFLTGNRVDHIEDAIYEDRRFAPALPPPEWDLVEALRAVAEDISGTGVAFNNGVDEGLHRAIRIARAYLAREEKPC